MHLKRRTDIVGAAIRPLHFWVNLFCSPCHGKYWAFLKRVLFHLISLYSGASIYILYCLPILVILPEYKLGWHVPAKNASDGCRW